MDNESEHIMPEQAIQWIGRIDSKSRARVELRIDGWILAGELNRGTVFRVFKDKFEWVEGLPKSGSFSNINIRALWQLREAILVDRDGFRAYLTFVASISHLSSGERERIRGKNK